MGIREWISYIAVTAFMSYTLQFLTRERTSYLHHDVEVIIIDSVGSV